MCIVIDLWVVIIITPSTSFAHAQSGRTRSSTYIHVRKVSSGILHFCHMLAAAFALATFNFTCSCGGFLCADSTTNSFMTSFSLRFLHYHYLHFVSRVVNRGLPSQIFSFPAANLGFRLNPETPVIKPVYIASATRVVNTGTDGDALLLE